MGTLAINVNNDSTMNEYHQERVPDFTDRFAMWLGNYAKSTVLAYKRRNFALKIQDLINLANAHLAKGVELGDPVYVGIYSQAIALCDSFANDNGSTLDAVLASAPALRELKSWAEYDKAKAYRQNFMVYGVGTFIAAITISIAIGLFSGIGYDVYHLITHIAR